MTEIVVIEAAKGEKEWCFAVWGNHDEHQCHKKPNHFERSGRDIREKRHECYCGVWW